MTRRRESPLVPAGGAILPVDKPEGPTSHDVVARARKLLRTRRVGHTGTLDPFASGLLLLCVGPATRLSQFLTGQDKEYLATARLGVRTDSGDRDGQVLATTPGWETLDAAAVEAAMSRFRGEIEQVPPALSAKKVAGERAHRRVRRGESVELPAVPVRIHELELLDVSLPEIRFRVRCASGTYIRALARDVGEVLGVGAHLTALRRTAVGRHRVEDAVSGELTELPAGSDWITPLEALSPMPRVALDRDGADHLLHGRRIPAPEGLGQEAGPLVSPGDAGDSAGEGSTSDSAAAGSTGPSGDPGPLYAAHLEGTLVAVCRPRGEALQPVRVFPQAANEAAR